MSDSIENLRTQMRAEPCPKARYKLTKQILDLRRKAEETGESIPAPAVRPIVRPKEDPAARYQRVKAEMARKYGTPAPSASLPARKYSGGVRDWKTEPPAHLKKLAADARKYDLDPNGGICGMPSE